MLPDDKGHNQGRIFEPVVSVEAWRTSCDANVLGSVHVDLTFREALLGAEPESQVRFQVSLRKATLKIIVSQRDPIVVVRETVDRGRIVESEVTTDKTKSAEVSGSVTASASTNPLSSNASASASARGNIAFKETSKNTELVRDKTVEQFVEGDAYCWEIKPRTDEILKGKVWDALSEPRLQTRLRSAKARSSDCEVRLIVECLRQDIEIRNIQLKSKPLALTMFREARNNQAAAEAFLRDMIAEYGFKITNFTEPFSNLVITNIVVPEE
jgi:hypothetical protein